ncbi:MAG TPA: glycosyltransferase [Oculatellaceae cyanobacterium]
MKTINHYNHVFVFIEVFESEGGIQSYVKDLLQAYLSLMPNQDEGIVEQLYQAEIFLLRDSASANLSVREATPKEYRSFPNNPFDTYPLKFYYCKTLPSWLGRLKLAALLLSCLIRKRPDHVFCGHIKLAPLIQILCQPLGIPYIVLTYGKEVWERLPKHELIALQQANCIWTISRYSCDRACVSNNLDPQKVKILPCAIDGSIFTPGSKPQSLIERYGLSGAKVLMTVARLWSGDIYKGVDVTIRALPKILQVFPEVKYLVIGRGDDQPRLAQLAEDLGVADKVIFAGFVPTDALVEHYRVADAYIMPSQEGFGIVYLEAMACGIPVLAGDDDGSADPLQDGRLGWRVPHRDPEAVAVACIEMLQGSDGRCDREWIRKQTLAAFSKDALTQQLKQLIDQVGC